MRRLTLFLLINITGLDAVPKDTTDLYVRVRPEVILREGPSINSRAITKIPFGYLVVFRKVSEKQEELLGLKGYWYEVQNGFSDARKGWVFAPLLRENESDPVLVIIDGKAVPETIKVPEVIFDSRTKLYWTSCNADQIYVEGQCRGPSFQRYSTEEGEKYCDALRIMGLKWKLPSLAELRSISDKSFNRQFPYSELGFYSSSTMRSNGTEDFFMRMEVPTRVESGHGMMGEGMIKCFAKK